MPRGGYREGAGRPPTYRRVTLDEEAAQQLSELVARFQARTPQAHWTAPQLLRYLITDAWLREFGDTRDASAAD